MLNRTYFYALTTLLLVLGVAFVLNNYFAARVPARGVTLLDTVLSYAELSTTSTPFFFGATSAEKIKLPILVYHIVRPSYESDNTEVRALALTPETFDAEMLYLSTAGYHVIRFSDLENHFAYGMPLPQNPIVLSFDDGWENQFTYAFPILKKYHYPATFFIFTNSIGRKGFMNWNELTELLAGGMSIGDHSRSHPYLTKITDETSLWNEIAGSKQLLEKHLHTAISEFAYPFGMYDAAIRALVEKAGYRSARGDYYSATQSSDRLFDLGALNAPTTTDLFARTFPAH